MIARVLFMCAQGTSRALLAASLLHARGSEQWEAWSTPPSDEQGKRMVDRVLHEQGIALLPSKRLIQPTLGQLWEQGIVLCNGEADT